MNTSINEISTVANSWTTKRLLASLGMLNSLVFHVCNNNEIIQLEPESNGFDLSKPKYLYKLAFRGQELAKSKYQTRMSMVWVAEHVTEHWVTVGRDTLSRSRNVMAEWGLFKIGEKTGYSEKIPEGEDNPDGLNMDIWRTYPTEFYAIDIEACLHAYQQLELVFKQKCRDRAAAGKKNKYKMPKHGGTLCRKIFEWVLKLKYNLGNVQPEHHDQELWGEVDQARNDSRDPIKQAWRELEQYKRWIRLYASRPPDAFARKQMRWADKLKEKALLVLRAAGEF